MTAFFVCEASDPGLYRPTEATRGPWDEESCHAGPVAAAIARELEPLDQDKQLARLTIELMRPVPMAGFRIAASVRRKSRSLTAVSAELTNLEGRACGSIQGMLIAPRDLGTLPTADIAMPGPGVTPGPFPLRSRNHDERCITDHVEVTYPDGENYEPGPTTIWMKTPPIVAGETPSPFQLLCPLADCGNGISRNAAASEMLFLNVDLTIVMHRAPQSDWLASRSVSFWEPTGLGLARAELFDEEGAVGTAMQTLLLRRP